MTMSDEKSPTVSSSKTPTSDIENSTSSIPSDPHPNGGYGWLCTIAVALINAHTWGLNSSYSIFLAYYMSHPNLYPGTTSITFGFIGTLSISTAFLISPLATWATATFGIRPTLLFGVVVESAALLGASWVHNITSLFFTQGIFFGVGMGFLFVPSTAVIPQWFTTKRSLANGCAAAGSGFGGVLYSLVSDYIMRHYSIHWAYRGLGIISFVVNALCVLIVRDRHAAYKSNQAAFELRLFSHIEYILLLLFGCFTMFGYVVLIFSLAAYATHISLPSSQGALVAAMFNLGQGLGRPLIGLTSDSLGRLNMAILMTFLCAVLVFAVWFPATSLSVLLFFAIPGGMVAGTFWAVVAPVTAEIMGMQRVPSALSVMWVVLVLPCVTSEGIALGIVEYAGGFAGAKGFVGGMYAMAAITMVVVRGWMIREITAVEKRHEKKGGMLSVLANCLTIKRV